jgi:hypothetical protein
MQTTTTAPPHSPPPENRRTNSAPPPSIAVEDVSTPLTNHEEPFERPTRRGTAPEHKADSASGHAEWRRSAAVRRRFPNVDWRKKWDETHDPFVDGRVLVVDCLSRGRILLGSAKTYMLMADYRAE